MSREIKFRFWNTEDQYYSTSKELSITSEGVVHFAGSEMLGSKYTPEQFTGLTDKNGVDIYENDIVELQWKHKTWTEPVVFDCGGFSPFTDTCGQYADPWEVSAIGHGSYKVIGNIHEHKYLLED